MLNLPSDAILSPRDSSSGQATGIADFGAGDRIVLAASEDMYDDLYGVVEDMAEIVLNIIQGDTATHEVTGTPLPAGVFRANAGGVALDANDRILYDTANGWLSFDPDGSGAARAVHFATLLADPLGAFPELTAADIGLVASPFQGTSTDGTGI